jgi:hypothetical protein
MKSVWSGLGWWRTALLGAVLLGAGGCSGGVRTDPSYPTDNKAGRPVYDYNTGPGIFSADSNNKLLGFGGGDDNKGGGTGGIGVNGYLWRASLDTTSFMPLSSADPFGGIIITDWYTPPETPGERMKVTVYIMDKRLRADAVKAAVFRQRRDERGQWIDAPVQPQVATDLENVILTRARQLRTAAPS